MSKIFKNLRPFWKMVLVILILLLVQAWCDLSLPQYTSAIIDTGIQKKGVEHILPEKLKADEYETAFIFMKADEKEIWSNSYKKEASFYKRTLSNSKRLDELDEKLSIPLLYNFQMSAVEETSFREIIAKQLESTTEALSSFTVEEIGAQMGVELKTAIKTVTEDNISTEITTVDMRPIFQTMLADGRMSEKEILKTRDKMEESLSTMGNSMIRSMGISYAIQVSGDAGVDLDSIQKRFLWSAGLRMVLLALIMGMITISVGFFASKIGAGVGMNLRNEIFQKVVDRKSVV